MNSLEASLAKRVGGARLDSEAIKALLKATTRAARPVMIPAAEPTPASGLGAIAEAAALGAEPAASSSASVPMPAGVCGASVAATGLSVPVTWSITVPTASPTG